ncbi:branched-chain amino acid transport system permease protein [Stackebrandtia albiflava]|uniref:Branched-chain amino acid transport system permease protein n=1 Tax=Stackebrandtia albiflava TaxID=406432 RepID=A0A562V3U2_9ACTN|nr:branched-chain amino acid ABC transporter permease [Stackebrandtia albiflava]TWJ12525.1 branched-chain amino acid transport system permease protein [Stackebrandtia albiflava]
MTRLLLDTRVWTALAVAALAALPFAVDAYTLSSLSGIISLGLLAVSVAVLTGTAGLPSLGQVAPYAFGMYTTVVLIRAGVTEAPVLLLASGAAAAVFCAVIGPAVVRTRGVVFLMLTLAVGELTAQAAQQWKAVSGGTDGSGRLDPTVPFWGLEPLVDEPAVYWYCLAVAVVVTALAGWAARSTPGSLVRGVRDNEARMRADGHRVGAYLLGVFVFAGMIAGIGGSLLVTSQRMVFPSDVSFSISALVLMAVVIGGAASLGGALVGAGAVILLRDWTAAYLPGQGPLVLGALFIAAVYLMPGGLAGVLERIGLRRRKEAT